MQESVSTELEPAVALLKSATDLPICVGFGISSPDQARTVGKLADGVVVGSALVRAAGSSTDEALNLAATLRAALDS